MTKTVIPTSPAELEEMLADRDKIQNMLRDEPATFSELVAEYAKAVHAKDQQLEVQVREQVQAVLADFMRDNKQDLTAQRPPLAPAPSAKNKGQYYNAKAAGAALDGKFESTGEIFCELFGEKHGNHASRERMQAMRNSFSSTVPSDGGFLIPEEFRAELMQVALETAIVRPKARVIPMAAPRIKFPMIDSTSNASSVFGGIVAYWTEEGAQLAASSSTFGSITLDAQKLTGYSEIPNELLADSAISVAAFVDQMFPAALAWFEDDAFFRGNGVGMPLGFLNAGNTAAISVAKESGQANTTIVWENIVKMYARILPTSIQNSVWIAHIDTFPELATMALSVGTGGAPVWLVNGADSAPMSILGRPVIFTEKAESLGGSGDLNLVDLSYYLIGDRQQITAMTSEHFKFNTDTTAYRIIQRVDGRPWLKSALTPRKGSNTMSPFVRLAAR